MIARSSSSFSNFKLLCCFLLLLSLMKSEEGRNSSGERPFYTVIELLTSRSHLVLPKGPQNQLREQFGILFKIRSILYITNVSLESKMAYSKQNIIMTFTHLEIELTARLAICLFSFAFFDYSNRFDNNLF